MDSARLLHVGDDPDADIGGAQDAGLSTAWINRTSRAWPEDRRAPDYVACDLEELAHALGVSAAR
jgi:putative hydrolase of the HAD superfamily